MSATIAPELAGTNTDVNTGGIGGDGIPTALTRVRASADPPAPIQKKTKAEEDTQGAADTEKKSLMRKNTNVARGRFTCK